MALPKELTTVTSFSKLMAAILFIILPFIGFLLGVRYQQHVDLLERQLAETAISNVKRHPTPTPDSTTNWKKYVNYKYGFKLNYPSNWMEEEINREGLLFSIGFKPNPKSNMPTPINYVPVITISINQSSLNLDALIRKGSCHTNDSCIPYSEVVDLTIDNLSAKRVSPPDVLPSDRIFLKKGNLLYVFTVTLDKSYLNDYDLTVEKKREIFNQILSTFKFLPASQEIPQSEAVSPTSSY